MTTKPFPRRSAAFSPADLERERWLDGIVSLSEGARLISVSVDTLKRQALRGRYQLIRVGERRLGVRRRDVLGL